MSQKGQNSAAQTQEEIPKPVLVSRGFFRGEKWKFGDCIGTFAEILPVFVNQLIKEAEARGAEEQRRKGAEIAGYIPANTPNFFALSEAKHTSTAMHKEPSPGDVPVYYSANVAALEARVKVLEAENITLKTRVINAAENLLSIETPCMKGDNFAVTICSHFEDCEGDTCDNGWHEGATKAYEEIKDAVLQHFRAALTREGGV